MRMKSIRAILATCMVLTAAGAAWGDAATTIKKVRGILAASPKAADLADAMKLMDEAIAAEPNNAEAYQVRGLVGRKMMETKLPGAQAEKALADFRRATTLDPKNAEAWKALAQAHHQASQSIEIDDDDKGRSLLAALDDYNHYLELKKNDAEAYESRAAVRKLLIKMDDQGDLEVADFNSGEAELEVKKDYLAALDVDPNRVESMLRLADIYESDNEPEDLIKVLQRAVKAAPKDIEANTRMANAARIAMDWDTEMAAVERMLGVNAEAPEWLARRADIYWRWRMFDKAIADYTAALKLTEKDLGAAKVDAGAGGNGKAVGEMARKMLDEIGKKAGKDQALALEARLIRLYSWRGYCYGVTDKMAEALKDFDAALAVSPDYGIVYRMRGDMYLATGDGTKAVENYALAADHDKTKNFAPFRARIEMVQSTQANERGDLASAATLIEAAIADDFLFGPNYQIATIVYATNRKFDRSLEFADRWVKVSPRDPEPWFTRGRVYETKGDLPAALENMTKSLELDPANTQIMYQLAGLHVKSQAYAQAIDQLDRAFAVDKSPAVKVQLQYVVLQALVKKPSVAAGALLKTSLEKAKPEDVKTALDLAAAVIKDKPELLTEELKAVQAALTARQEGLKPKP